MKENKTALMKATDLLAMSEQSSKNLRKKLLARKYEEKEVDEAIEKLKKYKYLNDEEFCKRQFEILYSEEKLSVKQICVKLIQKGFELEFVKKIIPEDTYEHEIKAAEKILQKKFRPQKIEDEKEFYKIKTKIWKYLATKGFEPEIITVVAENFMINCSNND